MPCYDGRDNDRRTEYIYQEDTARVDKLARMLCNIMSNLHPEDADRFCKHDQELSEWWKEHQDFDRKRNK